MGNKTIADIDFDQVERNHDGTVSWQRKKITRTDDGIEICWGDDVQLTGSYMLWFKIKKEEILRLYKRFYGRKFTREELSELGVTVIGLTPTQEELKEAVRNMKVSDIMAIITQSDNSEASSEETAINHRPRPRLVPAL